ncbi:FecCD family ABC transporter permease [Allonocardiopsis opalescens]|uniref:Iron complex transport system permease protein n=1 Tax=Allonocardiopsis opalescens TaxID=1144618 RepID=A0A2T0Q2N8_9ACTN|nr:iron ABC transporter permease [Allonocardiopsis opalescens]PRX98055.1 iron complex transport system permease protein [Allonocardiopsis opalescens]
MALDTERPRTPAPDARPLARPPLPVLLAVLTALLLGSVVLAIGIGPVSIAPGTVARVLADRLLGAGPPESTDAFIVWRLRAPRVVEGVFVGAGLAVAGTVAQALVRNPVADPYVLGLSSGASVGAVLVLTTVGATAAGTMTLPLAAFLGALAAGVGVFALARTGGMLHPLRLIMVGIAVGQLLGGLTSFLVLRAGSTDAQQQVMFWLLGSLAGAQWPLALTCAAVVGAVTAALLAAANRLNVLVLGDEGAAALGMDATRTRGLLFLATGLLTGTVVAVSGTIGFVGLVVPNLTRLLVGADHRRVLPVAALLGALLLVWADTAARMVLAPSELPIGILTAMVGVPFFVWALRRNGMGAA